MLKKPTLDEMAHATHLRNVLEDLKTFSEAAHGGTSLTSIKNLRKLTALEFLQQLAPNGLRITFDGQRTQAAENDEFSLIDLLQILAIREELTGPQMAEQKTKKIYAWNQEGIGYRIGNSTDGFKVKQLLIYRPPSWEADERWKQLADKVVKLLNGAS